MRDVLSNYRNTINVANYKFDVKFTVEQFLNCCHKKALCKLLTISQTITYQGGRDMSFEINICIPLSSGKLESIYNYLDVAPDFQVL